MTSETRKQQDAEYQRRCQMTKEEKGRDAIDRSVKRLKEADERSGGHKTESEIRSYMERIAERADRENNR